MHNLLTQVGHLLQDEPTLTQCNHLKAVVYIRVYSRYCVFHWFGQTYLNYIVTFKVFFTALEVLCALSIHSFPVPQPLATTDLLLVP